jgi:hypothetical protein
VIPQVDRIGGATAQISIFFNNAATATFISPVGEGPKQTGTVAGYPEYDGWVLITKDKRLPWIPQTLADRLDVEGEKRQKALADAKRRPTGAVADDAAGGVEWLEKQVRDYQHYRASFSAEQLKAPAVWGNPGDRGDVLLRSEANGRSTRVAGEDEGELRLRRARGDAAVAAIAGSHAAAAARERLRRTLRAASPWPRTRARTRRG